MKKTIKLIGTIAFIALLAFATSCGAGAGGGGETGDGTLSVSDPIETNGVKETDFSFTHHPFYENIGNIVPLSAVMDGSPSVKINGGKVNISLGIPKPSAMKILDDGIGFSFMGLTVDPPDTLYYNLYPYTPNGQYYMYYAKDDDNYAALVYVNNDVTINGTSTDPTFKMKVNANLKKGWNYYIISRSDGTAYTASTLPPGFKWVVEED